MIIENLPFIKELDEEQRTAVVTEKNAVVSAGAGSGKTRVLSARYGYLIMSGRCEVDQILTITFTNKAANEMYRRIYSLLSEYAVENEYARKAVDNFHKAWISTLDSFCLGVARNVCRRFGISPGFENNDVWVREEARSLALRFVLDKRNDPALQKLIAEKNMRQTADELFVRPVLYHSTVSSPLDFNYFEKIQREEICKQWNANISAAAGQTALIKEIHGELPVKSKLYEQLASLLPHAEKETVIALFPAGTENSLPPGDRIISYLRFLAELKSCNLNVGKNEKALVIKEAILILRDLYEQLQALANFALQWDTVQAVFPLVAEYQEILARKKREAGILNFNDTAHLAVDGLRRHKDIRRMYQDSFRMIMIDEFQDNNSLQRDLVDLLAGPARVFYVGDEKQSIYRFRGADVSVFRGLVQQTEQALGLTRNYRSRSALISAFNLIFGGYRHMDDTEPEPAVFPPDGTETADFQATYRWLKSNDAASGGKPCLHFAFFDAGRLDKNDHLKAENYEANYIAGKINSLVMQQTVIYNKECGGECACNYGDIAVLIRSHTHQHSLERAFKQYGIPYNADRPASLFNEAPVNDLWAYLKLLVYPGDTIAYGALLNSPFVRLSEDAFALCMLNSGEIFDESLDDLLPAADRERYRQARCCYKKFLLEAQDLSVSSLITRLWYDEGYRHEALWSASTQVYLDLYDLFFEQARIIEDRGGTLVDFLDYLEDLVNKTERPDDSILPGEESGGVRIMTIHRSKGLEFPVLFLYNCGSTERINLNRGLANYSEHWGVYLKLPQTEELTETCTKQTECDYFYLAEKNEHRLKTEAELRRLLYVAMTRAEQELYVTAVIPAQNKAERERLNLDGSEEYGKEFILSRLEQYKANPNLESISFLRLLPNLTGNNPLYTIEAIDCLNKIGQPAKITEVAIKEATRQAVPEYESIPVVSPYRFIPQIISASTLCSQPLQKPFSSSGKLDELLQQAGIEAQEFGTIVHGFIEAVFRGEEPKIPARFITSTGNKTQKALNEAALGIAENFFGSPLGRKAVSANFRKTEYSILTVVQCKQPLYKVIVSGKIDLIFDDGTSLYIVDFKTDRDEEITRYVAQLAMYKRAAEDIFGKPAECRLFYLRSGREADLNKEIIKTSPEELLAAKITGLF